MIKLDRGKAHRDCLDKAVKRWVNSHCRATRSFDPHSGEHIVRALIASQPPADIALLIGDCVHNMRAALDHIAYQLATNHTKALSDSERKRIEFPVFSDHKDFGRMASKGKPGFASGPAKLQHADPNVIPLIEAMQPYNGGNWELLALLHDLDRIDKHRELHVSVAKTDSVEIDCGNNARVQQFTFSPPGRIEHGDVLARFRCVPKRGRKGKVKPKVSATFTIALGDGPDGWAIVSQLDAIDELIRDQIVPQLARFL